MFFDLDEITTEQEALTVADELVKEAIQSAGATRRKRQKIRSCQAKIKMFMSWCRTQRWKSPILKVKKSFILLEEAIGEDDVQLWGI